MERCKCLIFAPRCVFFIPLSCQAKVRHEKVLKVVSPSDGPRPATEAICWKTLQRTQEERERDPCDCKLLHFAPNLCCKHVGHVLRQSKPCDRGCDQTAHPAAEGIISQVVGWFGSEYTQATAEEEEAPREEAPALEDMTMQLPPAGDSVSEKTARGQDDENEYDPTAPRNDPQATVEFWRQQTGQKFLGNTHLEAQLATPTLTPTLTPSPTLASSI